MPLRLAVSFGLAFAALGALLCDPAIGFGDAGELGAAASTWGVAHPTGFPVALLWTHAFELLPFGSIPFRHALSSALAGGIVVGVLVHVVTLRVEDARVAFVAAFVASGVFAWPTVLEAVLSMEVYAPAMVIVALAVHESQVGRRPTVHGLLVGLGAATHVVACAGALLLALPNLRRRRGVAGALMLAIVGAFALAYLPIASLRQPALDWGDPETLSRFWQHITASRIRDAFADAESKPFVYLGQLLELGALVLPAVYAWVRAPRTRVLLLAVLFDLVYGLWVNPMGVPERQVGHLFGVALAASAGLGVAAVLTDLNPSPTLRAPAIACALVLGASGLRALPREGPGHAVQERFEDSLLVAPARAVVLCGADAGCSTALQVRYAWGLRPDVDVLVPQHLWEPRDRARLRASRRALPSFESDVRPDAQQRDAFVQRAVRELTSEAMGRPLESQNAMGLPHGRVAGVARIGDESDTFAGLMRLEAWADAVAPEGRRARALWAGDFDQVGRLGLTRGHVRAAAAAFRAGIRLAPERSVGWSNLGVVLANAGDAAGAIEATQRAVERDPSRPQAWVNLARYLAAAGDLEAARDIALEALAAGIEEPELVELSRLR